MNDTEKRCQAMTAGKRQCRCKAVQYLIYPGDGKEYLACKRHANYLFTPCPWLQGKNPEPALTWR